MSSPLYQGYYIQKSLMSSPYTKGYYIQEVLCPLHVPPLFSISYRISCSIYCTLIVNISQLFQNINANWTVSIKLLISLPIPQYKALGRCRPSSSGRLCSPRPSFVRSSQLRHPSHLKYFA